MLTKNLYSWIILVNNTSTSISGISISLFSTFFVKLLPYLNSSPLLSTVFNSVSIL